MFQRIALTLAAAALLAADPALAQAPTGPPAPPPDAEKADTHEKHAKPQKAKGHGTAQTHHCVKDGKLMADLTNKKCATAGGVWERDADAPEAAAKAPRAGAPKPAP